MLNKKRLEHGAVAPSLIRAVATHRKGRVVRQGRQKREQSCRRSSLHLGPVTPDEGLPCSFVAGLECGLDECLGRRQLRQPEVVEVTGGVLSLRHTPWRPPDRAQPQPFAATSRSAESNDGYRHSFWPLVPLGPRESTGRLRCRSRVPSASMDDKPDHGDEQ
jgi:hypothetical protein